MATINITVARYGVPVPPTAIVVFVVGVVVDVVGAVLVVVPPNKVYV